YLQARGEQPVNLDPFRTLPSSKANSAAQTGRLTNLMELTVDTSYWARYRSDSQNPDLGDALPQAVPGLAAGKFPAIPRSDDDLRPRKHLQAIANTAAFHFGMIEQGGSSLYAGLAQRATDPEVLRILLSICPTEVMHFQTWQGKAGKAPAPTHPINDEQGNAVAGDIAVIPRQARAVRHARARAAIRWNRLLLPRSPEPAIRWADARPAIPQMSETIPSHHPVPNKASKRWQIPSIG